eukprot:6214321-Alexandrium_andersonii.AAC.1
MSMCVDVHAACARQRLLTCMLRRGRRTLSEASGVPAFRAARAPPAPGAEFGEHRLFFPTPGLGYG